MAGEYKSVNGRGQFGNIAPPPNAVYPKTVPKEQAGREKDREQAKPSDDHRVDAIPKSLEDAIGEDTYRGNNKSRGGNPR